ncbi:MULTISPECIES: hypothetical protein [unclassified Pseudomonas]
MRADIEAAHFFIPASSDPVRPRRTTPVYSHPAERVSQLADPAACA